MLRDFKIQTTNYLLYNYTYYGSSKTPVGGNAGPCVVHTPIIARNGVFAKFTTKAFQSGCVGFSQPIYLPFLHTEVGVTPFFFALSSIALGVV